jgi:hypothetical protein
VVRARVSPDGKPPREWVELKEPMAKAGASIPLLPNRQNERERASAGNDGDEKGREGRRDSHSIKVPSKAGVTEGDC